MNRSRYSAVLLLLFVPLAVGKQAASAPADALYVERGAIADGTYSNECLGFSLPIPAGWQLNSQVVGTDLKGRHFA